MSGFKRRSKGASIALVEQLEQITKKGGDYAQDPNEWSVTKDGQGNGSAIIRFLPAKGENGEDIPFQKIYNHGFKVHNQWYIENCPTSIGRDCPVCSANSELWESGLDSNKETARGRKRKLSYWGNIVVIQDKSNPENEGKVFKFRFGQKIMDKIVAKAKPSDEEVQTGVLPIDVTDPWEGCSFILKVQKVDGFFNYDKSVFGPASELFGGDEAKLEAVYESMHPLSPIVDASEFKSDEELLAKFNKVTGSKTLSKTVEDELNKDLDNLEQVENNDEDIDVLSGSSDNIDVDDEDLDAFFNDL